LSNASQSNSFATPLSLSGRDLEQRGCSRSLREQNGWSTLFPLYYDKSFLGLLQRIKY
jgi:hypothetical protein